MSLQAKDKESATARGKRKASRCGDGQVRDAHTDPDVIHMVSTEVEERAASVHAMVAEAAYFRASRRGFEAGHELEDWFAAEQEIERLLQAQHSTVRGSESRSE